MEGTGRDIPKEEIQEIIVEIRTEFDRVVSSRLKNVDATGWQRTMIIEMLLMNIVGDFLINTTKIHENADQNLTDRMAIFGEGVGSAIEIKMETLAEEINANRSRH